MRALITSFLWTFTLITTLAFSYSDRPVFKPIYNGVDDRAKKLVNEYKDLAKDRGIVFKAEIPVGFKKINNGTIVGLCTYGFGWRQITIDEEYYASIDSNQKLALIFHELTHCYCGRDHDYGNGTKYPPTEELRIVEAKEWQKVGGPKPGRFDDACPTSLMYPIVVDSYCVKTHYNDYVQEMFNRCNPYGKRKIRLYEIKKIGYSYCMDFVGSNNKTDDCMIVALHNACLAAGRKSTYKKVYHLSLKKGWYKPGQGFLCKYLDEAFDALKLSANVVEICPKTIWQSCFNHNKVYLFIRPSTYESFPGHAMVAVKGEKGVKIHNPYEYNSGWRTLHRAINNGDKYVAIEVSKS